MAWNIPAGQFVPVVQVVPPPSFLPTGGAEQEKEKALTLCKRCSATARTQVCYRHCFSHKPKTWHLTGCSEENYLHPSQTLSNVHRSTKATFVSYVWEGSPLMTVRVEREKSGYNLASKLLLMSKVGNSTSLCHMQTVLKTAQSVKCHVNYWDECSVPH